MFTFWVDVKIIGPSSFKFGPNVKIIVDFWREKMENGKIIVVDREAFKY
jgi:hypothetical protein